MEAIVTYLKETYRPLSILLYGSYANGSPTAHSDFDALVITQQGAQIHDTAIVHGVQLDVFVYPRDVISQGTDPEAFLQIFDGKILLDTDDLAWNLRNAAREHLAALPKKSAEEIQDALSWCRKMLLRAQRQDAEGLYRMHWLLTDSLPIACDILGTPYLGPKKALAFLEAQHPALFARYAIALKDPQASEHWIRALEEQAVAV